ncbi:MAG TPA: hypothetical protein VKZ79_20540 [Alphaproteobacteria bacterium]|nr:hypothetical protein [Alphaproteobacteria bacterium]
MAVAVLCGSAIACGTEIPSPRSEPPGTISQEWKKLWPSVVARAALDHGKLPGPGDQSAWARAYATTEEALEAAESGVPLAYGVGIEPGTLNGISVLSITPKSWTNDGRVLIYVHGGASPRCRLGQRSSNPR